MTGHHQPSEELRELLAAFADERLTEEQERRLAELLCEDQSARAYYLDYVSLITTLQWEFAEAATTSESLPESGRPRRRAPLWLWAPVLAASLVVALLIWFVADSGKSPSPDHVATLTRSKGCRWGSEMPPEENSRLTSGSLQLVEGLAEIRFDSGAVMILEAPADLEILSQTRCRLGQGRLVARVPPTAVGFTVETPSAVIKVPGTEFGVLVSETGTAEVSVLTGLVEVEHRRSGAVKKIEAGGNLRFTSDAVESFEPDMVSFNGEPNGQDKDRRQVVTISTAQGRGADTYVESIAALRKRYRSDSLLLVKNSPWRRRGPQPRNRKAYLKFDVASLKGAQIIAADLKLMSAPSGIGFASLIPDATFAVYGLLDEGQDHWKESMTWEKAPANVREDKSLWGGAELNQDKVVLVGTFVIPQGQTHGTWNVGGTDLIEFLNCDTNGVVTFILVRQTQGNGRNDLVHAFASRRHPELHPPTLKLLVKTRANP